MKARTNPIKDKLIYIYKEEIELDDDGNEVRNQVFLNQKDKPYFSYIRQVAAKEQVVDKSNNYGDEIELIINYRPNVEIGQIVIYGEDYYRINYVDNLFFLRTELKIRAYKIKPDNYSKVVYAS